MPTETSYFQVQCVTLTSAKTSLLIQALSSINTKDTCRLFHKRLSSGEPLLPTGHTVFLRGTHNSTVVVGWREKTYFHYKAFLSFHSVEMYSLILIRNAFFHWPSLLASRLTLQTFSPARNINYLSHSSWFFHLLLIPHTILTVILLEEK